MRVHLGVEQAIDASAVQLGTAQSEIGAPQQLVGTEPVLGRESYADAGADADVMARHLERGAEQMQQPPGEAGRFCGFADRCLNDGIFVGAHARHCVDFACSTAKPLRNCLQQGIADRMSERIIDRLELIEIEI